MKKLFILGVIICMSIAGCSLSGDKTDKNYTNKSEEVNKKEENNQVNLEMLKKNIKEQFSQPKKGDTVAVMTVKGFGDIKIKFFDKVAPKAVENFVKHSQDGYYNNLTFHRVIENFMIQGGDPNGNGTGGTSIWDKPFEDEFPSREEFIPFPFTGAIAMANSGKDTNGSQFFIVNAEPNMEIVNSFKSMGYPQTLIDAYLEHGGTPHLYQKHTVFGQVYEGMDVVDKISKVDKEDPTAGIPKNKIIIEKVEIKKY